MPVSLFIISLEANPCQHQPQYRKSILTRCAKLFQLDGERLTVAERRAAGHDVETDSEDDETEQGATSITQADKSQLFDAEVSGKLLSYIHLLPITTFSQTQSQGSVFHESVHSVSILRSQEANNETNNHKS